MTKEELIRQIRVIGANIQDDAVDIAEQLIELCAYKFVVTATICRDEIPDIEYKIKKHSFPF